MTYLSARWQTERLVVQDGTLVSVCLAAHLLKKLASLAFLDTSRLQEYR